jgi:hypothetical protein
VKKTPGWFDDEIARHAQRIVNEGETKDQALASLRMLVRDTRREFGNAILDEWTAPRLATAVLAAQSQRAAQIRDTLRHAEAPAVCDDSITALRGELETLEPPSDPAYDLHLTLFPDFPFRSLKVTPARYEKIHAMTRHELDAARNILFNKTGHAISGAQAERRQFDAFYNAVRPLMSEGDIVEDAERRLAADLRLAAAADSRQESEVPQSLLSSRDLKVCEGSCH